MDFGSALEEAKNGHPIRRRGWNGKGMWVAIRSGYEILIPSQPGHFSSFVIARLRLDTKWLSEGSVPVKPCFMMLTADTEIVLGWAPSQTDILAEDWEIADA